MTTIAFDTLAFTEELTAAGFSEPQAKAQARAMVKIMESQELATKADLAVLQKDMAVIRQEMATKINVMEIKASISETKVEIMKWVAGLMLAQTGLIIAAIKLLP